MLEQVRGGADCLMTAPSGARLPRSTAVPVPAGWSGSAMVLMTSWFQHSAPATLAPIPAPVTVIASAFSRPAASSRITAGRPPA